MKKYIVFSISFILVFMLFQVLSGMFLTLMYTPDTKEAWNMSGTLSSEAIIRSEYNPYLINLFIAFISATIAYFIPKKLIRTSNTSK